jgi:hypothetical protein
MPNRIADSIAALDWNLLQETLDGQGYAAIPSFLDKNQCKDIINSYEEEANFRSTIDMARYRFGSGEYKYYQAPLPDLLQQLRYGFYPELAKTANRWLKLLGYDAVYPPALPEFLDQCHQ